MNILMTASEALPFCKTGGLADVSYSLSKEFVKLNHNVSFVLPFYKGIEKKVHKKFNHVCDLIVTMNWRKLNASIYHVVYDKIDYFLIKNDYYFERDNGLYGYYDDGERYAFFSLAVIELMKYLPIKFDVLHLNDWQVSMLSCLIKTKYGADKYFSKIKCILTIHNPLFKGYINRDSLFDLYNLPTNLYDEGKVRLDGQVSTLKAGIVYSDKITTVSPTHRNELLTIDGSKGLYYDLLLREDDFIGIVNGVDEKEFNPRKDKNIYVMYNESNVNTLKSKNKVEFCKENGLNPKVPLFAIVSRLTSQKGLELIYGMAQEVVNHNGTFAILGSGEYDAECFFNRFKALNPKNSYVYIGYNDLLAHKLYASCDFFIMPSAFEPCGIGQMIAHRYGALPIVRRTGGLVDTVTCLNNDNSNYLKTDGIGFDDFSNFEANESINKAFNLYYSNSKYMNALRKNAMKKDHRWKKSALMYIDLYNSINK